MANPYISGGNTQDEFNGLHGQYSPESILNALNNLGAGTGKTAASPYDAILNHSTDFGASSRQRAVAQPPTPTGPVDTGGQIMLPGGHHGGGAPPNPLTPTTTPPAPTDPGSGGTPNNPTTTQAYGKSNPGHIPPALWNEVDRWVQGAKAKGGDYSYLYDHPELVTQFRAWQSANGAQDVNPEDWLKAQGYPSTLAGTREGVDTFARWKARQAAAPQQQPPPNPGTPPGPGGGNGMPTPPPAPPAAPAAPGAQQYLDQLNKTLQTQQDFETQNQLRAFRSAAGAVGVNNTGAYLPGMADTITGVAANYDAQRSAALLGASEAERNRAFQSGQSALDRQLQQYGIDVQSYTSRFDTTTTAGVTAAANQMQYDLGIKGIHIDQQKLEESIRNNTLNYNLGVGGQDLSKYQGDQNSIVQLFNFYKSIGQEQLFSMLFGQQSPPTNIPYSP